MDEVRNAIIERATLSTADHGILSPNLSLNYGGSGQGFGGFCLYSPRRRDLGNFAGLWIWRVLEVAGVEEWSNLKGRPVRARIERGFVTAIGHILKDDWFDPTKEFAPLMELNA